MKKFEIPEIEINVFSKENIITTSVTGEPLSAEAKAKAAAKNENRITLEW